MKPVLHPSLINNPLGDPGLIVNFMFEKRAFLFDLGDLSELTPADLLKVSDVFVSHTHIDHFIGFDRLLRITFGRDKTLRLYGPENFIANVEGKLAGFTWNLVDRYEESITLEVTEVREDRVLKATFRAIDQFKRSGESEASINEGLLLDESAINVRCAILEHRVPCLGFAVKERFHVNVNKVELEGMGLSTGPWLNKLKQHVFDDAPDDTQMEVPGIGGGSLKEFTLKDLKNRLLTITPGQKIAYITDTVYNEENKGRIVSLVRDADVLFCESPFVAEEEERALERRHLTSRQAGLLAREAGVKQLKVFHFSSRHTHQTARLYEEAEQAFKGN